MTLCFVANAQDSQRQTNWQQRVNSHIIARLDTVHHIVNANIEIEYFNYSPDTLHSIYFHLWPNAYKDNSTYFAKQEINKNKEEFVFSDDKAKGYLDSFKFVVNGDSLKWKFHPLYNDVIVVFLNNDLIPNQKLVINTPFRVKIPDFFSRMGQKDNFYALTQWFPKPAVYDVNGWNPMPYLDQGEFYSEFGDYKVEINVPSGFEVASSGHLINDIDSSDGINYVFEEINCHDFAWFASKSFKKSELKLHIPNQDSVTITVYALQGSNIEVDNVLFTAKHTLLSYSEMIGPYPYQTCKVVIGDIVAGLGMEYPGITICSDASNNTIIHEIGHNWFYGALGSNERIYPWMDESINSYFEKRSAFDYNSKLGLEISKDPDFLFKLKNTKWFNHHISVLSSMYLGAQGNLQKVNEKSSDMTEMNYGLMYGRGAINFAYLSEILGDSLFLKCFQTYYKIWQFRHPLPKDMQDVFEKTSSQNLSWFFNDVLSDLGDIDLCKKKSKIEVKGSEGLSEVYKNSNKILLNSDGFLLESNYRNNGQKKSLIRLSFPYKIPSNGYFFNVNMLPVVGYNYYDKMFYGINLFNDVLNASKFTYQVMTSYSSNRSSLIGYSQLNYKIKVGKKPLRMVNLKIIAQQFGLRTANNQNSYYKIAPELRFDLDPPSSKNENYERNLAFRFTHIGLEKSQYFYRKINDSTGRVYSQDESSQYFMNFLNARYFYDNHRMFNRVLLDVNLEYAYNYKFGPNSSNYLKPSVRIGYKHQYKKNKKHFRTALYLGTFIKKKNVFAVQSFWMSANGGPLDYKYENPNIGRAESSFGSPIVLGQFFNGPGIRNNLVLMNSDLWMSTLKTDIDLPGFLPIKVYADIGMYQYNEIVNSTLIGKSKMELLYTFGIEISLLKNSLNIFIPFIYSNQFKEITKSPNIFRTIGFNLKLNQFYPNKLVNELMLHQNLGLSNEF